MKLLIAANIITIMENCKYISKKITCEKYIAIYLNGKIECAIGSDEA